MPDRGPGAGSRPGARPSGSMVVPAEDGVPLHVEITGDPDAPVTVVLTHGFTASHEEWGPQLPVLRDRARLVLWDHRGHGRSGWTPLTKATIDQTGRDLAAVLAATSADGPVLLVGHSMGGMSIMALARQRPELFGTQVVGVFLLATSAGDLVRTGVLGRSVGLLRRLGLLPLGVTSLQRAAPHLERLRRRGSVAGRRVTRRYLFGREDAHPAHVRQVQDLLERTPYPVTMAFCATFLDHDEEASLQLLRQVPVTVVAAAHDRLTPAGHAVRIAGLVDGAELVLVPGAGHVVNLTRPDAVNAALARLLDRVGAGR